MSTTPGRLRASDRSIDLRKHVRWLHTAQRHWECGSWKLRTLRELIALTAGCQAVGHHTATYARFYEESFISVLFHFYSGCQQASIYTAFHWQDRVRQQEKSSACGAGHLHNLSVCSWTRYKGQEQLPVYCRHVVTVDSLTSGMLNPRKVHDGTPDWVLRKLRWVYILFNEGPAYNSYFYRDRRNNHRMSVSHERVAM